MAVAHFQHDYPILVDELLNQMPEDDAMARAVGSPPDKFKSSGYLERRILEQYGLRPIDAVVDIGCGSGRLAAGLRGHHRGLYAGFDIVEKLIEYADRRFSDEQFHFFAYEGLDIPLDEDSADVITFFSVFTHPRYEETHLHLREARRVLRPGGTWCVRSSTSTPIGPSSRRRRTPADTTAWCTPTSS
ncbi:MAG: methyltransferase domain-containing protein [Actinomycetota bacterium]|nr:methyltransferase domain-containing protein [Actinomycetota bacterium]